MCGGFTQEDVESGVEEQIMLEALKGKRIAVKAYVSRIRT
jgi:hypothetical protein